MRLSAGSWAKGLEVNAGGTHCALAGARRVLDIDQLLAIEPGRYLTFECMRAWRA